MVVESWWVDLVIKPRRAVRQRKLWEIGAAVFTALFQEFWACHRAHLVSSLPIVGLSRWELNAMTTNSTISRPIVSSHG